MKKYRLIITVMAASLLANTASASDKPDELLKTAADLQKSAPVAEEKVSDRWLRVLEKSGWGDGVHAGGVLLFPERNLIVSSGEEFTRVPKGQPGWIESRVVAFERAEMQAKAKIVRYFAEMTEASRSLEMMENAGWTDGEIAEIREVGSVAETLEKIGKKSLAVTDAVLDDTLRKLDPDYDPTKYENLSVEQRNVVVEDAFKRRITSLAYRSLIGVTPMYSTEGEQGGQYLVLVGVIWSPKLNHVALSLGNDVYNLKPVAPGQKLEYTVPDEPNVLIGTMGTRVLVDENGEYAVVAYAQAQPRRASPARQQSSINTAKKVADGRARAQIVNFVKESLTVKSSETASELSQEYSDLTVGTETVRNYQEKIAGSKVKVTLRGLRTLKEWDFPHPETGETVAGTVLAWAPSGSEMAKRMEQVMNDQARAIQPEPERQQSETTSNEVLESMPVNTSQY